MRLIIYFNSIRRFPNQYRNYANFFLINTFFFLRFLVSSFFIEEFEYELKRRASDLY